MLDVFSLKQLIKTHKDFPKKGAYTRDFSELLNETGALHFITSELAQRYLNANLTRIVALKGRGTMFAAILAYRLNLPLALIRDFGEEPGEVMFERAPSAKGDRTLEMRQGMINENDKVLLFDDIIASGSSLIAATTLIRRQKAEVHEVASLINLPDRGGSERLLELGISTYSVLAFKDGQ